MTKITHGKITHYIDGTKKNANKRSSACTFTGFPRDCQLNTTDAPSITVGGQDAVNYIFIYTKYTVLLKMSIK